MFNNPLDDTIADQLAAGEVHPDDAPPGYSEVAALLHAAHRNPPEATPGRESAIADIAAAIRLAVDPSPAPTADRRHRVSKLFTLKALAIAVPAMALTVGSAAAATGVLPGSAQSVVSQGLSHVGISVPSGKAVGPDASGPAKAGLCEAYQASLAHGQAADHSVAFANLAEAAGGASNISAFCAGVVPSPPGPATTGAGTNSAGSNGVTGSKSPTTHPESTSGGAPTSVPGGPPTSEPHGQSSSTPHGPPASVPVGPPTSEPHGPPTSVPDGPPTSEPHGQSTNPGQGHKG